MSRIYSLFEEPGWRFGSPPRSRSRRVQSRPPAWPGDPAAHSERPETCRCPGCEAAGRRWRAFCGGSSCSDRCLTAEGRPGGSPGWRRGWSPRCSGGGSRTRGSEEAPSRTATGRIYDFLQRSGLELPLLNTQREFFLWQPSLWVSLTGKLGNKKWNWSLESTVCWIWMSNSFKNQWFLCHVHSKSNQWMCFFIWCEHGICHLPSRPAYKHLTAKCPGTPDKAGSMSVFGCECRPRGTCEGGQCERGKRAAEGLGLPRRLGLRGGAAAPQRRHALPCEHALQLRVHACHLKAEAGSAG